MSAPVVITADYDAVPARYWERRYQLVHDLAEAYRYSVCSRCSKPIGEHVWFLIHVDTDVVDDCSEEAVL